MLNPSLREEYWRGLEARINYYFQGTMAPPAMKEKAIDRISTRSIPPHAAEFEPDLGCWH
jgi:hypothetical protein